MPSLPSLTLLTSPWKVIALIPLHTYLYLRTFFFFFFRFQPTSLNTCRFFFPISPFMCTYPNPHIHPLLSPVPSFLFRIAIKTFDSALFNDL
jgi:hypothetical protein